MTYFETHPAVTRAAFALLLALLLPLVALTFYKYASSPTDENTFEDPPSYVRVAKVCILPNPAGRTARETVSQDTLYPGDLICRVNGRGIKDGAGLDSIVGRIPSTQPLTLEIFRPATLMRFNCRVAWQDVPPGTIAATGKFINVTDVVAGGASDRAGMRVGDLILRINGDAFASAFDADKILRRAWIGRTLSYEVLRSEQLLTLNITLAKFGFPLPLLGFSLSGVVLLGVGAFLALKRPRIKAATLLGLSFILLGFSLSTLAIQRDPDVTPLVAVRGIVIVVGIFVGLTLLFRSGLYFPKERPELLSKRWLRIGSWALLAFVLCVFTILRLTGALQGDQGGRIALLAGMALIALSNLAVRMVFAKSRTPEYRKLARLKVVVSALALVVVVATIHLAVLKNSVVPIGFAAAAVLAVPLTYLYTIGRYRLLDMNLSLRRNVQYSLLSILWGLFLAGVFVATFLMISGIEFHLPNIAIRGISIEVPQEPLSAEQRTVDERIVLMVLAIVLWYILWKLRRGVQAWIDRKYYRTQYDYRRAAGKLAEVMATKLSMVELGRGIVQELAGIMHLKRAAVFFFRDESVCCCSESFGVGSEPWNAFCAATGGSFARAIQQFSGEFRVDYLPPDLKRSFQQADFRYIVPIRSKDRLIGAIVLGEKLSEAMYSQEDLEFLLAASKQASVAIENAFLYEELAERERMRHELEIARKIQLASLPQKTPSIAGLDIAGISLPAHEVGGDFFDYLNGTADKLTVVVGDVSGKGTSAALYMSKVQGILRSLHGFTLSPGQLFVRANQLLCEDLEKNSFVTAVGAAFDPGTRSLLLARAGHLPLYVFGAGSGTAYKLTPRGLGLGLNNAGLFVAELEERTVSYAPGDVLLFVTDGVTEARNPSGEEFGEERLLRLLQSSSAFGATHIRDRVLSEIKEFAGEAAQHDDLTVVVIKAT